MKLKRRLLFSLTIMAFLFKGSLAYASEVSTDDIVGDNDIKEENHSNYVVPSSEELETINEMKVINNVDDKGNVFDHENLVGTKQFLTVSTPDGKTYYIIISYEQFGTKVNLLKDMSETDVLEVTDNTPQAGDMTKEQAEELMANNAQKNNNSDSDAETPQSSSVNIGLILLVIIVVGGVVGFIKLRKNKTNDFDDD